MILAIVYCVVNIYSLIQSLIKNSLSLNNFYLQIKSICEKKVQYMVLINTHKYIAKTYCV